MAKAINANGKTVKMLIYLKRRLHLNRFKNLKNSETRRAKVISGNAYTEWLIKRLSKVFNGVCI